MAISVETLALAKKYTDEKISGGSGSISYGYSVPQSQATDGSLFYLLSATNKKLGEFLYMLDHWALVSGTSFTVILSLLARKSQGNYSEGALVYSATKTQRLIGININVNGVADTQTLTAPITGGSLVDSAELTTVCNDSNRNHVSNVSLIDVKNGDTITMSNESNGGHATQLHAILDVVGLEDINDISVYDYSIKSDSSMGLSKTILLTAGKYLVICFESSGGGANDMGANITYDKLACVSECVYDTGVFACKVMVLETDVNDTIDFTWADKSSYVSRGYLIYSLS